MRERQQVEKLRIVVQHLFEMRHEPAFVDRIARETAAEVIVDAALAHALEREVDGTVVACLACALSGPPQEFERHRLRELRRAAQAAMRWVDHAAHLCRRTVEFGAADDDTPSGLCAFGQPRHQRAAVLLDAARVIVKEARDVPQHIDEPGPPVLGLLGKIRATPERFACRGEKHGQRPAAALAQEVQRRHVDLVDVGTLLAIDFDVDDSAFITCAVASSSKLSCAITWHQWHAA